MADKAAIEKLTELLGIRTDYHDFRGQLRSVPVSTRRELLTVLGFPGHDTESLEQAVQDVDKESWCRLIPPVVVIRADRQRMIQLQVRQSQLEVRLHWRLWYDDGRLLTGNIRPTRLQRVAEKEIDGQIWVRCQAELPEDLTPGFHELVMHAPGRSEGWVCRVIIVPAACFEPPALQQGQRSWGLSVQLYALRSDRNWGIGDFGDLRRVAWKAGCRGADLIGLNPLHALFPADPLQHSPYRPSSRSFLNILYIEVPGIAEAAECGPLQKLVRDPAFSAHLEQLRSAERVDYAGVTEVKLAALRLLFEDFRVNHIRKGSARARAFQEFVTGGGPALETHALFEALHAHFARRNNGSSGWQDWPADYHDPCSDAVMRFALRHRDAIDFYQYLQWIAASQLAEAQATALESGMRIGLYRDLAVGVSPDGAETWASQRLYATGVTVGAPPDELALKGQDWGLPPLHPLLLQRQAYSEFIHVMRNNMRYCGALRIDHVMGLARLWWVPSGSDATDGAYVHYPFEHLLGIVALESQRADCLVIGEDLGTVPDELRVALPAAAVYSYRVLMFEKETNNRFRSPEEYPRRALATVSTHDLPPLFSYWNLSDIDLRARLGLYPNEQSANVARATRETDKKALLQALHEIGLTVQDAETMNESLMTTIHQYLARSAAALIMIQPEDWLGMLEPTNVPGTSTADFPNWRRKLCMDIDAMLDHPAARKLIGVLNMERGRL